MQRWDGGLHRRGSFYRLPGQPRPGGTTVLGRILFMAPNCVATPAPPMRQTASRSEPFNSPTRHSFPCVRSVLRLARGRRARPRGRRSCTARRVRWPCWASAASATWPGRWPPRARREPPPSAWHSRATEERAPTMATRRQKPPVEKLRAKTPSPPIGQNNGMPILFHRRVGVLLFAAGVDAFLCYKRTEQEISSTEHRSSPPSGRHCQQHC